MDFELTNDQAALVDAVEQMLRPFNDPKAAMNAYFGSDPRLDHELARSGFLEVALEPDYGSLEAGLVVETIAQMPLAVEVMASGLVVPMSLGRNVDGPIALIADPQRPARFLEGARNAVVVDGAGARLLDLEKIERHTSDSFLAYPMGQFSDARDVAEGKPLSADEVQKLHLWWQIGLCLEAVGAMSAAVDFTVDYVTERRQFRRPLGSFQAIQHRLAERTVQVHGLRWLARHAAWSGAPRDAVTAAAFALRAIPDVVHDCHQFNGALGITTEHALHLWTYRLVALQGELTAAINRAGGAAQLWLEKEAA